MKCWFLMIILIGFVAANEQTGNYDLSISSIPVSLDNRILARIGGSINVTCFITSNIPEQHVPAFNMNWNTPQSSLNSKNRVFGIRGDNAISFILHNFEESDAGEYKCEARLENDARIHLQKSIRIAIKNRKPCANQMFGCLGSCIGRRFVCDGRKDCKDGSDESEDVCGPDPCFDKLHCEDGRCIPHSWCCDQYHAPFHFGNCTAVMKLQCCQQLLKYNDPHFISEQRFSDMGFLQTTIYTVIGCAMAFMFIVTILVIAICRVHIRRTALSRCSGQASSPRAVHHHALQHVPLYDLDVFFDRSTAPETSGRSSGVLVTYNINNGVQFVRHPIDPPPYCEIVTSPPKEGPPPPYASRENIHAEHDEDEPEEAVSLLETQASVSQSDVCA